VTRSSVINPYQKFYELDGVTPLSGGTIQFYYTETTDPLPIYSNNELTVPQTNPYELDAGGAINGDVYFDVLATLVTYDSIGAEVQTFDNVSCFDQTVIFGTWDQDVVYEDDGAASDIVQSPVDGNFYISIQANNLDHEPSVSPLWWQLWPFASFAKGVLFAGNTTGIKVVAAGTNDYFLKANSAVDGGVEWAALPLSAPATQAQMEAATSNAVAATPGNTNWHPGVAKAWLKANGTGTTILASHNITSITDGGTGSLTVTLATDFSTANYSIVVSVEAATGQMPFVSGGGLTTAGAFQITNYDGASGTVADPQAYYICCHGDQA
jgi:hypothetical protein